LIFVAECTYDVKVCVRNRTIILLKINGNAKTSLHVGIQIKNGEYGGAKDEEKFD
jgi:hypothetical protein